MPIATDPSQSQHDSGAAEPETGPALDSLLLQMASRLVSVTGDPLQTLQAILLELQTVLKVDCIGLSLLPTGSDDIHRADHVHATLGPCPARELLQLEPSLVDQLRQGRVVIYPPTGRLLPSSIAAAGIGTVLLLPLYDGERWIGAWGLATRRKDEHLSARTITSLQTFAHVAVALLRHAQAESLTDSGEAWMKMALEAGGMDVGTWDLVTGEFHATFNIALSGQSPAHKIELATNYEEYMQRVHPEHRGRLMLAVEAALSGEQPTFRLEHILIQPDGRQQWVEYCGRMRRDRTGAPRFIEGTMIDISQRKQMEQELNEQRKTLLRQTRLMEQSESVAAIGGWEWDLMADQLYFTPETYRIYGFTLDSPLPPVEDVVNRCMPEFIPVLTAAMNHALASGEAYDLNMTIVNTEGKQIPVRTTGRVEFENGHAIRLYGVLQDITHTADLERQLRESRASYTTSSGAE